MIRSWSFSAWETFNRCPHAAKLKYVDKLPGPPPKDDSPLTRGSALHEAAEAYIRSETDTLPTPLRKLQEEYDFYRQQLQDNPGSVLVEPEWAFDSNLNQVEWNARNVWLRIKPDIVHLIDATNAVLIDLKTGRRSGNEVKHNRQGQLYAGAMFHLYPELFMIRVEFWYPDEKGQKPSRLYDRDQGEAFLGRWLQRGLDMTTCTDFPPKPNTANCRYCDYGPANGNGECVFGVEPL